LNLKVSQAPLAYIYNPCYSGSRDQEDRSSKPAWANSLRDPMSKYPTQEGAGGVAQVVEQLPSKHETLNFNPISTKRLKLHHYKLKFIVL
jgi:hypothetical protein